MVIAAVALAPERMMSCEVPAYAVDLAIAVDHIGHFKEKEERNVREHKMVRTCQL